MRYIDDDVVLYLEAERARVRGADAMRAIVAAAIAADGAVARDIELASFRFDASAATAEFTFAAWLTLENGTVAFSGDAFNRWTFSKTATASVVAIDVVLPQTSVARRWRTESRERVLAAGGDATAFVDAESSDVTRRVRERIPNSIFYNIDEDAPWHKMLLARFDDIAAEAARLPPPPSVVAFKDYNIAKVWRKFAFLLNGVELVENSKAVPTIMGIVRTIPGVLAAEFMTLAGNSSLPQHTNSAFVDFMRCHLGIDVPERAAFFGDSGETVHWARASFFCFDDTRRHHVRNLSSKSRTILNIDVVRPALTRAAVRRSDATAAGHVEDEATAERRRRRVVDELRDDIARAQWRRFHAFLDGDSKLSFTETAPGAFAILTPSTNVDVDEAAVAIRARVGDDLFERHPIGMAPDRQTFWTVLSSFYPAYGSVKD